ncbi:MAG: hypothetical protein JSS02_08845 [Planctomycetes bacterium]|nr:hypothetical protein [Planctomycetota bacterium]
MNPWHRTYCVLLCLAGLLPVGCGDSDASQVPLHRTSGMITFGGKPLAGAIIMFHAVKRSSTTTDDPLPVPGATSQEDGSFSVSTFDPEDGMPEGEYYITVSCEDRSGGRQNDDDYPELLPTRYQNPATSGLKVKIVAGDNELKPLELFP